jgi:hypothetical protein
VTTATSGTEKLNERKCKREREHQQARARYGEALGKKMERRREELNARGLPRSAEDAMIRKGRRKTPVRVIK